VSGERPTGRGRPPHRRPSQSTTRSTSSENGGAKRELKGKHGDLDVTIQMEQEDTATTKVEVYARKNLAEWDKDYARTVLDRIIHAAK
jgi:hypothetical protein